MARKKQPAAKTLAGRQNQLVNLAAEEAERRLRDGTASSQIITTLLKFGSVMAQLELEKMKNDIALSQAKKEELEARANGNELYEQALAAFKSYQGTPYDEDGEYYYGG